MSDKKKDNLVECAGHGRIPGYIICIHVMLGKLAAHVERPEDSDGGIGEICCERCCEEPPNVENFRLICGKCAEERGFTKEA